MPKIPTFTTQETITGEVGSVKSNIQMSLNQTISSALAPVTKELVQHQIKQKDFENKTEALRLENDFIREMQDVYTQAGNLENQDQAQSLIKNQSNIKIQKFNSLASNKNSQTLFNQYALSEVQKGIFRTSTAVERNTLIALDTLVAEKKSKLLITGIDTEDGFDYNVLQRDLEDLYVTNYKGKISNAVLGKLISGIPNEIKFLEADKMISNNPREALEMLKNEKDFVGLNYDSRVQLIEKAKKTLAPMVKKKWELHTQNIDAGKDVEPFNLDLAAEVLEAPTVNAMITAETLHRETADNRKIILTSSNKIVNEVVEGIIDEAKERYTPKEFNEIEGYYNNILEQRNKQLDSDPVQFLITTNDNIESLVMEIDSETNLERTTALQLELSNILIKEQNKLGIHSSKQKVMTNSMATNFINNYKLASTEKDTDKQYNMLSALETQYGDLEPQVFAQLMEAGLPQAAKFLSSGFATPGEAKKILSLDQPEKIEALKNYVNDMGGEGEKFTNMREAIRQDSDFKDLENVIRRNVMSDTGEVSPTMEGIVDFLSIYAANEFYAGDSKTFKEATKNAALMFTKNFEVEDTYYFDLSYKDSITGKPVSKYKREKIIQMLDVIKSDYLPDFKAVAFKSKRTDVKTSELTEKMEFQMREHGEWRNTADGTGFVYGIVLAGDSFAIPVNENGEELYIPKDYNENTVPGTDIEIDLDIQSKKQQARGYFDYQQSMNDAGFKEDFTKGKRTNEIPEGVFGETITSETITNTVDKIKKTDFGIIGDASAAMATKEDKALANPDLKKRIKKFEGVGKKGLNTPYQLEYEKDGKIIKEDFYTVGHGHKLPKGAEIREYSDEEIDNFFEEDMKIATKRVNKLGELNKINLNTIKQDAYDILVEMALNMGSNPNAKPGEKKGLFGFTKTLKAIKAGEYKLASEHMVYNFEGEDYKDISKKIGKTDWYKQVKKNRAMTLKKLMSQIKK